MDQTPPQHQHFVTTSRTSISKSGRPNVAVSWIEENCPTDDARKTGQMTLDTVGLTIQDTVVSSRHPQMLAFKKADLKIQHENFSAYTAAPTHNLKSIAASTKRFLDRGASRKLLPTQLADDAALPCSSLHAGAGEDGIVLDGLRRELSEYLSEAPIAAFKEVAQGRVVWCDPLQYWMVCTFPRFNLQFSPV